VLDDFARSRCSIIIGITQLDTNKAVVGAVREPPLRLISLGSSPQLRNSYHQVLENTLHCAIIALLSMYVRSLSSEYTSRWPKFAPNVNLQTLKTPNFVWNVVNISGDLPIR
jgi:hypothetical protein